MKISAIFAVVIMAHFIGNHNVLGGTLAIPGRINGMTINDNIGGSSETELNTCDDQLNKYRQFILRALYSFDDICDMYIQRSDSIYRDPAIRDGLFLLRSNPLAERRSDIWTFYKMLITQFDDIEFSNVLRDAILERCRTKQEQHEKRNSVVLGKKQRFHSWGGKRSEMIREMSNGAGFAEIEANNDTN